MHMNIISQTTICNCLKNIIPFFSFYEEYFEQNYKSSCNLHNMLEIYTQKFLITKKLK